MKRKLFEKSIMIIMFIVFYNLIQIIMFYWLKMDLIPGQYLIDFTIIFIMASLALLFQSHRASKIYLTTLLVFLSFIALVNETLNLELNGDIFSIYDFILVGEATNVFLIEYVHFDAVAVILAIDIAFVLSLKFIDKSFFKSYLVSRGYHWKSLVIYTGLVILLLFGVNLTNTFKNYSEVYNVSLFKRESISQYGMMGFYFKELDIYFFDSDSVNKDLEELGQDLVLENPNTYNEDGLEIPYTGLLEGKNVITIMVESGQSFAINETLTPNIYKMTQEGLYFPNHYSENSTKASELIGMMGTYPSETIVTSTYAYDFSFSLANILKKQGYRTTYFHENSGSFYDRAYTLPQVGFDEVYFHDDMFPNEDLFGWSGDYTLDSRTMDRMLDIMFDGDLRSDPFYWFWTTLSMHGPYNYNVPSDRGLNNVQKFTNLGYFDQIDAAEENGLWTNILSDSEELADPGRYRFYQAAMMDFDVALGKLFAKLEEENILDDTVILFYGDHYVYYHQLHLRINDVELGDHTNVEMYKTMFAIYNSELTNAYLTNEITTSTTVDKFITPYDILPTYFHLMGIPYYKNFTLGESLFSDLNTIFYSNKMSAFFNQSYFSFNDTEIAYPENIDLNLDQNAVDFLLKTELMTDKIIWLELWIQASETKINE